jgi:hypothetical protein
MNCKWLLNCCLIHIARLSILPTLIVAEMDSDLRQIVAAVASLSDDELARLIAAAYAMPETAPGLLAWIDRVCDWELNRRRGFDYELLPPEAAIPPEEDAVSLTPRLRFGRRM